MIFFNTKIWYSFYDHAGIRRLTDFNSKSEVENNIDFTFDTLFSDISLDLL